MLSDKIGSNLKYKPYQHRLSTANYCELKLHALSNIANLFTTSTSIGAIHLSTVDFEFSFTR